MKTVYKKLLGALILTILVGSLFTAIFYMAGASNMLIAMGRAVILIGIIVVAFGLLFLGLALLEDD